MKQVLLMLVVVTMLSGCATVAPPYQASFDATNQLRDSGNKKVSIGEFKLGGANPEKLNRLTIRGGSFKSPANDSYAEYLQLALRQQFYDARRISQNSNILISGVLLDNKINASGFSIGFVDISAQFVVHRSGKKKYDKVVSIHHEWPSSFAGATAIPAARQNYPIAVQKLLTKLFDDRLFTKAVR